MINLGDVISLETDDIEDLENNYLSESAPISLNEQPQIDFEEL